MGNNYADMDEYVRRLDRDRVRLVTKLKVRSRLETSTTKQLSTLDIIITRISNFGHVQKQT